jgi:drug/metabolite transporter (DMT)-like permease
MENGPEPPMSRRSSLIQVHAAVVLFGLAGLFGKWLALPPTLIVLGRVVFGSLALAIVLLVTGRGFRVRTGQDALLFLLQGFILALHWVLFFRSIQISSVAVGLLSYSSFPVFTVLLEPVVFRERLDRLNVLMGGLCLGGILLIVPRFDISDATVRGLGYGLGAGLTFAILTLINRFQTSRFGSLEIALGQDLAAVLFLSPFLLTSRPVFSARTLLLLALLGIFCTALAHTLFIGSMRRIKAQTAAIISSLEPVYGMAAAALLLGESWPLRTIMGGVVILGTTLVVSRRARTRGA